MKMKNSHSEEYKIRDEDLAPFTGIMDYLDRCEKEPENDWKKDMAYSLKVMGRAYLLALYNVSIVAIFTCSIAGLEKVFSQ